jgi:hypothetical protein
VLFVNLFENAFFCFEDFTFRAVPGIRNILPCCTRLYALLGISFQGIIDIMTFETYASYHLFRLFHGQFNSKKNCTLYFLIFFPLDLFEFFLTSTDKPVGLSQINLIQEEAHDGRKAALRAGVREFSLQG